MKIISCKSCGVLLDKDVLHFPEIEHGASGDIISDCILINGTMYPAIPCPNCKTLIDNEGDN